MAIGLVSLNFVVLVSNEITQHKKARGDEYFSSFLFPVFLFFFF